MELVLIALGLCLLGVLATRFGVDSRDSIRSKEHELAGFGWQWNEPIQPQRNTPRQRVSRERASELLAKAA